MRRIGTVGNGHPWAGTRIDFEDATGQWYANGSPVDASLMSQVAPAVVREDGAAPVSAAAPVPPKRGWKLAVGITAGVLLMLFSCCGLGYGVLVPALRQAALQDADREVAESAAGLGEGVDLGTKPKDAGAPLPSRAGKLRADGTGGWPALLSGASGQEIALRSLLVLRYGKDGTLAKDAITDTRSSDTKGNRVIVAEMSDGSRLAAVSPSQEHGSVMAVEESLTDGSISTSFGPKGNSLRQPTAYELETLQSVLDWLSPALSGYAFPRASEISFSESQETADLSGNFVVERPDGYSQVTASEWDASGNDSRGVFLIVKDGRLLGLGMAPYWKKD